MNNSLYLKKRSISAAVGIFSSAVTLMLAPAAANAGVKLDQSGFSASSDDGQYTFGVHGRIQFDTGWFDDDNRGDDNHNGSELRRVRLAVSGKFADWSYVTDVDLASGDVVGQTIAVSHAAGPGLLSVGQIKPFFSLENTTDDQWASLQERAWASDLLAPGYRYGGQWIGNQEHWVYGLNFYNETNMNSDANDGIGGGGRLVWLPLARDTGRLLHLGVDVLHDEIGQNDDDEYPGYTTSARLAGHLSNKISLVSFDDGRKVKMDKYVGEFAYSTGPVYVQAEYAHIDYDDGAQTADLDTGYARLGWFVTGQTRGYDFKKARATRPSNIGPRGAWELVASYDTAHGNQIASDRRTTEMALGANWYASANVLVRVNYIHGEARDLDLNTTLDKVDAITTRLQLTF